VIFPNVEKRTNVKSLLKEEERETWKENILSKWIQPSKLITRFS